MECKNCEHQCHCNKKCSGCSCKNCEHNALDEFHKNLGKGFKEAIDEEVEVLHSSRTRAKEKN